ncbi:MAG: SDR family oxidoreductase [Saprospiraceae bacterium]
MKDVNQDYFRDKTVVITGGVKGIGHACTQYFLNAGANVAIWDITPDFEPIPDDQKAAFQYVHCNVASESDVAAASALTMARFQRVDILVNNAGIQRYSKVAETSEKEWDLVMNVNLKGAFLCAKHLIPIMQQIGKGVIINVSSVQAFISQQNVAPYTTSKTALLGLTRSIAVDYAPEIRAVAVCPGTVDTPMLREAIQLSPDPEAVLKECMAMHLGGEIGKPEDIAALVGFLAGPNANFITGQAIRIDGGLGISIGGSKRES